MIEAKTHWRAPAITKASLIIYNFFKPSSIVDFGAANGFYLYQPLRKGCDVLGIEGTVHWLNPMAKRIGRKNCLIQDMRKSFDLGKVFDLAISIEMLEHLENEFAEVAVENIVKHGKAFLITASSHKGGYYHENPRDKDFWINLFESNGVVFNSVETSYLQHQFKNIRNLRWLREDLMVFYKQRSFDF